MEYMDKILVNKLDDKADPQLHPVDWWIHNMSVWHPWQVGGQATSQGKPSSGHRDTFQGAREQWGHSGGDTCWIRRFYATECDGNWSTNISHVAISGLYKHTVVY